MKLTTIMDDPGFPTRIKTVLQGISDEFGLGPVLRPSDIRNLVHSGKLKMHTVKMCGVKARRELREWAKFSESANGLYFKQCPHCGQNPSVPK